MSVGCVTTLRAIRSSGTRIVGFSALNRGDGAAARKIRVTRSSR